MVTRRVEVNEHISDSTTEFVSNANATVDATRVLNNVNYDLREMTTLEAVDVLTRTLNASQVVKKNWQIVQKSIGDINTNLDWYIARVKSDLIRYRKRFYDEQEGRFPRRPENN